MSEEEIFEEKKITKEFLREQIRRKRQKLSREEVEEKSKSIKEKLFSLPEFQSARTVAFYVAMKKSNEVETEEMIKECLKLGKRVLVPITDLVEDKIVFSEIKSFDDLLPSTFEILEPVPELRKILPHEAIRLIVVPGIVFDLHGHRIGYGLGFYDKMLPQLTKYVSRIGLAFELQVVEKIPNEIHDAKLNKIITEERVIEC
jgi:5-formyltetrahydrofolate cyclo-ligase